MKELKWKPYTYPDSPPLPQPQSQPSDQPKRKPGRPRKNPTTATTAATSTSTTSLPPSTAKQVSQASKSASGSRVGAGGSGAISNMVRMVVHPHTRPNSPTHASPSPNTPPMQPKPSQPTPPSRVLPTGPASAVPSSGGSFNNDTSDAPNPAVATGARTSASSARNTVERARQTAESIPSIDSAASAPSPPSTRVPALALVTGPDVDQAQYDPAVFIHDEGLGAENEDSESSATRTKAPDWFMTLLSPILADLRQALKSRGRSRQYESGTFWIRAKSPWFMLNKANLKPVHTFACDFFVWDPLSILGTSYRLRCPTPGCTHHLTREGVVERPRRVVDLDRCFWLIGYVYGCRAVGGCGLRFRSWDPDVMDALPAELASEFPAILTWRSALSKHAFGVVRSCFQHGMGSAQVSDLIRMQHLRRYDELRLLYLQLKLKEMQFSMGGEISSDAYEVLPDFEDRSSQGFHGFTPSGQWIRDVYDKFIESHRATLNQHTAMLSGRVCAIDHSHKLAKHVFKVDGVPIFTALLTVTNEKGEIVVCVFVATKSHSQFDDALRRLAHDLTVYGHGLPEVFYTDNMVDKAMLEKIFPSLLEAVVPIDKYSHLPSLTTPDFVRNPTVLDSETSINNAMQAILDDVPEAGNIVVGFDSEWNVDMTQYGRFGGHSPPAVVQIAYKDAVFILKVGEMLSRAMLPVKLVNLLQHSQVIKAGRQVNGDLGRLATACNRPPGDFRGGLDLAAFAKERFLIKSATASLADIVALLLQQCLPKPASERISNNWSDDELSLAQLEYAARDAYASLILYHEINKTALPATSNPDQPLLPEHPLFCSPMITKKPAARGVISPIANFPQFNGVNVTKTRTVISIHEVLVPGAIIGINKDQDNRKRALSDFGIAPFDLLAHRSHVRIVPPSSAPPSPPPSTSPQSLPPSPSNPPGSSASGHNSLDDLVSVFESLDEADPEGSTPATASSAAVDAQSALSGAEELGPEDSLDDAAYLHKVRSRVLKDIFHVFHMLYLSRTHGLRLAFIRAFRDICLIPHPSDKARIETYLSTKKLTWDDMLRYNPKWLWRRCRRTVPPAEVLHPLVHRLFMLYGPLRDAKTNLPLFNAAAWKTAKNILELIRYGYVSDVPGVVLYYCIGFDAEADGLPLYRCIRGTNMVEGGVHTHLLAKLPSRGASVRHMVACLLDFVLRHNLTVGHFNSTGKKYTGHDSIWLTNKIQELEITLGEHYSKPAPALSWVNGNLYVQSEQSVGIVKIPQSVCASVKIQPYHHTEDQQQKQAYLARMQGTRKPVLPVHTLAEKKLFSHLMLHSPEFQSCKNSITTAATVVWNRRAEAEDNVYYKLEEQLTSYFNGAYKDGANIRLSCARVRNQTSLLDKDIRDPARSTHILNTNAGELVPKRVVSGFIMAPAGTSPSPPQATAFEQQFAVVNQLSEFAARSTITESSKRVAVHAAIGQPAAKRVKSAASPPSIDVKPAFTDLGKLGEGAFGSVHKVRDTTTGDVKAVKFCSSFDPVAANEHGVLSRVGADPSAPKTVLTPVALYEEPATAQLCTVMTLYAKDLLTRFNEGSMSPACTRQTMAEVITGVEFLHKLKIIHRDIKPENVLLTSDGHAVLADLGLAKAFPNPMCGPEEDGPEFVDFTVDPNATHGAFFKPGPNDFVTEERAGTPGYQSLAQYYGQAYSFEADVWALGLLMHLLVTGTMPFDDLFLASLYGPLYDAYTFTPLKPVEGVDPVAWDLICGLLRQDPTKAIYTVDALKAHEYFRGADWDAIAQHQVPAAWQVKAGAGPVTVAKKPFLARLFRRKASPVDAARHDAAQSLPTSTSTLVSDAASSPTLVELPVLANLVPVAQPPKAAAVSVREPVAIATAVKSTQPRLRQQQNPKVARGRNGQKPVRRAPVQGAVGDKENQSPAVTAPEVQKKKAGTRPAGRVGMGGVGPRGREALAAWR
ncbi:3'-5' exonuclease domain-containing protein [Mycena kentingensis (nom. inval.)]|nr:3'-5' exonuclease domain-containing protein [Mycena kentingensis (nom. inval.)]